MTDNRQKFRAVAHQRLPNQIADQIEWLILERELQVGDALPAERELATLLGVSRNILREAIGMLAQKGLVETRPGAGTYVTSPSVDVLRDTLDFVLRFNQSALLELVEARRCLEVEIAAQAAERATPDERQGFHVYLEAMEAAVDDPLAYVESDVAFHEALARLAKNDVLRLLLNSIRRALRENIRTLISRHPTALGEAMTYHRWIARAICEGQPDEARSAMREHLDSVARGLGELRVRMQATEDAAV